MRRSSVIELLIIALALWLLLNSAGCENGPAIKIYSSAPEHGGLYREQSQELILYQDSGGFLCTSPQDFRTLMEWCSLTRE